MKRGNLIWCALLLPAMAQAGPSMDAITATDNEIGLNLVSTQMNYSETGNGVVGPAGVELDSEDGSVGGFSMDASLMRDILFGRDYVEMGYDRVHGSVGYTGSYQSGVYGSVAAKSDATLDGFHLRVGHGIAVSDWLITPYLEFGNHEWDRDVGAGAPGSVSETYTHDYYGLGAMVQLAPSRALVLTLNGLAGRTYNANMNSFGADFALGDSALYRIGFRADYAVTTRLHLRAGVGYESFDYGASSVQYSPLLGFAAEPDSKTRLTTLDAGLAYAF